MMGSVPLTTETEEFSNELRTRTLPFVHSDKKYNEELNNKYHDELDKDYRPSQDDLLLNLRVNENSGDITQDDPGDASRESEMPTPLESLPTPLKN